MNNNHKYTKISKEEFDNLFKIMESDEAKEKARQQGKQLTEKQSTKTTDMLLDEYNDYTALYTMFGDQEYKDKANSIMSELKSHEN